MTKCWEFMIFENCARTIFLCQYWRIVKMTLWWFLGRKRSAPSWPHLCWGWTSGRWSTGTSRGPRSRICPASWSPAPCRGYPSGWWWWLPQSWNIISICAGRKYLICSSRLECRRRCLYLYQTVDLKLSSLLMFIPIPWVHMRSTSGSGNTLSTRHVRTTWWLICL